MIAPLSQPAKYAKVGKDGRRRLEPDDQIRLKLPSPSNRKQTEIEGERQGGRPSEKGGPCTEVLPT